MHPFPAVHALEPAFGSAWSPRRGLAAVGLLDYTRLRAATGRLPVSDVLERIAAGDSSAVAECIDLYGGLVWSLARRMAPRDAEDAVQDIFIDLWKSAGRFDPSLASEKTFVATIARRRLVDRLRKAGRRPQLRGLPELTVEPSDDRHETIEQSAEAALAVRALKILNPDQRKVIQMSVVLGMSHSEIAEATGLAIGTVKSHIWRGLNKVREQIAESAAGGRG